MLSLVDNFPSARDGYPGQLVEIGLKLSKDNGLGLGRTVGIMGITTGESRFGLFIHAG
jgi:hypothetical protein